MIVYSMEIRLNHLLAAVWARIGHIFSDATYLKVRFRLLMGKKLDLKSPKTFSEKMQWLKLYDRKPEYTTMVDKYAVKKYVADIIGEEYIIPTLGIWEKPEDIEWNKLPRQFVLKSTNGGGSFGVVICKDKAKFDKEAAIRILKRNMKTDWRIQVEWPYKNVPHRVIAEQFIEPPIGTDDLLDYKFFCFGGKPKYCQVISGRGKKMCIDFFDKEWVHQPFHEPKYYPFADEEPTKPKGYEKMWDLAEQLAGCRAFSRIDFYDVNDKIYFGEITFYPTSGIGGFDPEIYDKIMGEMIEIGNNKESL